MIKIIISFFILIYIESKEPEGLKVIPENIPKINFGKDNYYNKNRNQLYQYQLIMAIYFFI